MKFITLFGAIIAPLILAANICAESEATAPLQTPQTILVFGAGGKIGGLIVENALERGHRVVGVSRRPEKLTQNHENFSAVKGNVTDQASFASLTNGVDAVVISVDGSGKDYAPENSVHARAAINAIAVMNSLEKPPYVIQVGGATTIHETWEAMEQNLPWPTEKGSPMYGIFFGHLVALRAYRDSDINWTVITPPYMIRGWSPRAILSTERHGPYRTSTTGLVMDEEGKNEIYVADFAVAVIDEVENRQFQRQRFTVGY